MADRIDRVQKLLAREKKVNALIKQRQEGKELAERLKVEEVKLKNISALDDLVKELDNTKLNDQAKTTDSQSFNSFESSINSVNNNTDFAEHKDAELTGYTKPTEVT